MEIICPNCGQTCEAAEEPAVGQHMVCPFCDVKFNYTLQNTTENDSNSIANTAETNVEEPPEKIQVICPNCGAVYEVDAAYIGETTTCGTCDKAFVVKATHWHAVAVSSKESSPEMLFAKAKSAVNTAKDTLIPVQKTAANKTKTKTIPALKSAANAAKVKTVALWQSGKKGKFIISGIAVLLALWFNWPSGNGKADAATKDINAGLTFHDEKSEEERKPLRTFVNSLFLGKNEKLGKVETIDTKDNTAVATSVRCLLNAIRRPNDRRVQVLSKSLESCPKDFQEAVIKYLDSVGKKVDDYMPETNENFEKEVERELYRTIRRGSPIDVNPQFAGMKMLAVADAVDIVKRSRESSIESAKLKLKTEIENAANRLIDIAENMAWIQLNWRMRC